jgi:hypothetical protein
MREEERGGFYSTAALLARTQVYNWSGDSRLAEVNGLANAVAARARLANAQLYCAMR